MLSEWSTDAYGRRRSGDDGPTFASLRCRLIEHAQLHVRNGYATERGLARATATSQPHVHNILAGKRGLSIETADALLCAMRLSVYDLL